jgi:RimJ/RimL family protein N-acetyltransferase
MNRQEPTEISFRRITNADFGLLDDWLRRAHVAAWWDCPEGPAGVEQEFGAMVDGESTTRAYFALREQRPIGLIQSYVVMGSDEGWWVDERDPGARGVDLFLAESHELNRGLGTAVLRAFLALLFADPAVSVVQADPSPDNVRAIRCFTKAGFAAVGPVTTPDGFALLMRCDRKQWLDGT